MIGRMRLCTLKIAFGWVASLQIWAMDRNEWCCGFERRLPDSCTHLQCRVFRVDGFSSHLFGIRGFRKHLKFSSCSTGADFLVDRV